jgi:hypothetical protein
MSARRAVRPAIIELMRTRIALRVGTLPNLLETRVDYPVNGDQSLVIDGHQIGRKLSVHVADAVEGLVRDGVVRVSRRTKHDVILIPGPAFGNDTPRPAA